MDIGKTGDRKEKQKKTRKRRYHEARREIPTTPTTQNNSIISKHRITKNLGIYNKAKRSDTILREQNEQKDAKKKSQDLEEQMKKDLSKVLDVSSFRINTLGASADSQTHRKLTSNVFGTYLPSEKNSNSPHECATSSICGSAGDLNQTNTPYGKKGLAFKTPLQEISESLIESLQPGNTFNGRDYFSEIREQMLKVFKQSSANQEFEKHDIQSELYKRLNKRKDGEATLITDCKKKPSIHYHSNNNSSMVQSRTNTYIKSREPQHHEEEYTNRSWEIHMHDEKYSKCCNSKPCEEENTSSDFKLFKQLNSPTNQTSLTNERRENIIYKNLQLFQSHRGKSQENVNYDSYSTSASTFDILDFLDHTTQKNTYYFSQNDEELVSLEKSFPCGSNSEESQTKTTTSPSVNSRPVPDNTLKKTTNENPTFFPHQKDEDMELLKRTFPEVSPLKKPSLNTPTPPKFYRRKMF